MIFNIFWSKIISSGKCVWKFHKTEYRYDYHYDFHIAISIYRYITINEIYVIFIAYIRTRRLVVIVGTTSLDHCYPCYMTAKHLKISTTGLNELEWLEWFIGYQLSSSNNDHWATCPIETESYKTIWHTCRKISNIRRTKSQNLNDSRLVLHLSLPNLLKPGVK